MPSVSLVVPFYNESSCLRENLPEIFRFLEERDDSFELILGDDGSTDDSREMAKEFASAHPEKVRLVRHFPNQGKGAILTRCFSQARGDLLCFIDADLEISLRFLESVLQKLQKGSGEVVVGSKLKSPQRQVREKHRHAASYIYNFLVRWVLGSNVSDHQCGLKGFQGGALRPILPKVKETSWTWDTEVLLLLQKKGVRIHEVQVELSPKRKSRVAFFRTIFFFLGRLISFLRRGLRL